MDDQPLYMAETGTWEFLPGDPTGLANPKNRTWFSVITDGPYTSVALAEQALNKRISQYRDDFVTVTSMMEPASVDGSVHNGGYSSWRRDLVWHDRTGLFGDEEGWQVIRRVQLDQLP